MRTCCSSRRPAAASGAQSKTAGIWHPTQNEALADYSVFHLEWDRMLPDRLLAVTWSDLYASTDLAIRGPTSPGQARAAPLMPFDHGADPKPFAQLTVSRPMAVPVQAVILWGKPLLRTLYAYDGVSFTQHWPFPRWIVKPRRLSAGHRHR